MSDFNETLIFSTDFRRNSNIKFRQNLFCGSRVVPCGRTEGHGEVIVDFRNFANAPEKVKVKFALQQAMKEVDV